MGSEAWEVARIVAGRPTPGAELTGDFNPLEAGLFHALSLDKGCYIGQETISKVGVGGEGAGAGAGQLLRQVRVAELMRALPSEL